jgi:hypothetical protein
MESLLACSQEDAIDVYLELRGFDSCAATQDAWFFLDAIVIASTKLHTPPKMLIPYKFSN